MGYAKFRASASVKLGYSFSGVDCRLVADTSGRPINPIFKRQAVQNVGKGWMHYYDGQGIGSECVSGEVKKVIRLLEHEVATRMEERRNKR
jgi:hypothetical protein